MNLKSNLSISGSTVRVKKKKNKTYQQLFVSLVNWKDGKLLAQSFHIPVIENTSVGVYPQLYLKAETNKDCEKARRL